MSSPCRSARPLALAALAALSLAACQREERDYHGAPPPNGPQAGVGPTSLAAGGQPLAPAADPRAKIYETNAFHVGEGKRWYDWYNCYGCHAAGGGGDIGPPLIDDEWLYGGTIEQIHASIMEGRPNGMPAFRTKLTDVQAWQLAAYIRAMGGNVRGDVAPSRGDEARTGTPLTQLKPTPARPVTPADRP
jgi:cytochrome c oxidase cbb3-type subunit 3